MRIISARTLSESACRVTAALILLLTLLGTLPPQAAHAIPIPTTITFESGTDGTAIGTTISGLAFSAGWVYGDWRSAHYNGKYPDGDYTGKSRHPSR